MFLQRLRIDRFGRHSNLEIDAFTDGLQVVHGPKGVGKHTILRFLRATLYGFDSDTREHYLPMKSRGFGGSIDVQTRQGRKSISRYDDGSVDGRLTIEHSDGRVIGHSQLDNVMQGVTDELFDCVYGVDFTALPQISRLTAAAERAGLKTAPTIDTARIAALENKRDVLKQELYRLGRDIPALGHLREQRHQLLQRLEAPEPGTANDSSAEGIRLEETHRRLQTEHAEICCQLESLGHTVTALLPAASRTSGSERNELDALVKHWRESLRQVSARKQQLQHSVEDQGRPRTHAIHPRDVLAHLENLVAALQSDATRLQQQNSCHCAQIDGTLSAAVNEISASIYRLCDALADWESRVEHRAQVEELGQLSRCESEMQLSIRGLVEQRRQRFGDPIAQADSRWCRCESHQADGPAESKVEDPGERNLHRSQQQEALQQRLADLEGQMSRCVRRLDQLRHNASHEHHESRIRLRQRLDTVEQHMRDAERRQHLLEEIAEIEINVDRLRHNATHTAVVAAASRILQRLSDGRFKRLQLDMDSNVTVADATGKRIAVHRLSQGDRHLTYLALCLSVADALKHQGVRLPMVLLHAFDHLDRDLVDVVVSTLGDFALSGHQVVLLTPHDHVQQAFRATRVPVRSLTTFTRAEVWPSRAPVAPPKLLPVAITPSARFDANDFDYIDRQSDAEEFPGELTDRVRFGSDNDDDSQSPVRPARFTNGLSLKSPIEDAPSIDMANAVRFRKIEVTTIGDLLQISAIEAENHLHYAGVTAEMVRQWQAQARLVCRVPHLRAYDARILVACGITDPDELAAMSPERVRTIVRRFAQTSRGQEVIDSGSTYERERLEHWLHPSSRQSRTSRSDQSSASGSSSRSKSRKSRSRRSRSGGESRRRARATASSEPSHAEDGEKGNSRTSRKRRSRRSERTGRSTRPSGDSRSRTSTSDRDNHQEDKSQARDVLKMNSDSAGEAALKFYLNAEDAIVDAPSIGPKTAERLAVIGVNTVAEFLDGDPDRIAEQLGQKRIKAKTIRAWQQQAALVARIPQLRGHDAQILVALEVTDPEQLASQSPAALWSKVEPFIKSKAGARIIRNGKTPDLDEVQDWIRWAAAARRSAA